MMRVSDPSRFRRSKHATSKMLFGHATGIGYVRNACQDSVKNPGYKRQGLRIKRR
jgi:hypothetical protein